MKASVDVAQSAKWRVPSGRSTWYSVQRDDSRPNVATVVKSPAAVPLCDAITVRVSGYSAEKERASSEMVCAPPYSSGDMARSSTVPSPYRHMLERYLRPSAAL